MKSSIDADYRAFKHILEFRMTTKLAISVLSRSCPAQGFKSHIQKAKNIFFMWLRHVAASIISLAATFLQRSPARSFRCVSSFAKSHARLACSVVNALTTARCRYQSFAGLSLYQYLKSASLSLPLDTSLRMSHRSRRRFLFQANVISHSFCRSSFPNRTR